MNALKITVMAFEDPIHIFITNPYIYLTLIVWYSLKNLWV